MYAIMKVSKFSIVNASFLFYYNLYWSKFLHINKKL